LDRRVEAGLEEGKEEVEDVDRMGVWSCGGSDWLHNMLRDTRR
jgi:hypothetical protein